ncbi:MAG TPA: bifunctional diguanylate cyclase/phosphodiesterase [Micromonosporaceae bacterium]|jgi:diguanylate cyclase (GGDEF)-like protein
MSVIGAGALVSVGLVVWAVPHAIAFAKHAPSEFWAMTGLALVVDVPLFAVRGHDEVRVRTTLSACFTVAIFLLWGAAPAIAVQAAAAIVTAVGQRYGLIGGLFLTTRLVCALAVAEVVVLFASPRPILDEVPGLSGRDLGPIGLLVGVWFAVSFGLLVLGTAAVTPGGLRQASLSVRSDLLGTIALVLLVAPLLTTIHGWWNVLIAVPMFAWNQLSRQQARQEERLRREPVTGLLNREGLIIGLEALTLYDTIRPEHPRPLGIVLVNVESVLDINRTLGRDMYERVVAEAARRLGAAFGADQVGRLSGEAFVVIRPGLTEPDALSEAVRVSRVLQRPIMVHGIPFAIDAASGVSLSPEHGRDFITLVAKAELAMSEARRLGRPAMPYVHQAADVPQRRIAILTELHAALRDPVRQDEIAVVYQPQVRLATGRLAGAEALVRWTHPQWGPVPADELIEAVEPSEVMHLLTRHMLDRVCAQVHAWNLRGMQLRVAVNASVQDLHDREFPAELADVLRRYDIPPDQLTIEITERMLIDDVDRVARAAESIAALGIGLSLDDFGTGYASMQQLRALPLTEVKIDKSYVSGMTENAAQQAIVTSVHQLARALNLDVVAEGVEDHRTAAVLTRLPRTIGQGWYFGRPVSAAVLEEQWGRSPRPARRPARVRG